MLATVFNSIIRFKKQLAWPAVFLCLSVLFFSPVSLAAVYMTSNEFVEDSFVETPVGKTLWLKDPHQQIAKDMLGHKYRALRLRYWIDGGRTAWILDEIGKEAPITIGVVVSNSGIEDVRILAYRETRGWEVRHPFFTEQFQGLSLKGNGRLTQRIDGISGATLSVRAVTNVSRFALKLHELVAS